MKGLTVETAKNACGATLVGDISFYSELTAVVSDSRKITEGCMFAAIKGARADGHDFIGTAFENGAACCLCEKAPENPAGPCLVVENTVRAMGKIAALYRSQFDIPVLGIIGSVGKTTAKEMVSSVLSQKYNVLKTEGNLNNELGVPTTVFRLEPQHDFAVVEMGISDFGEMTRLAQIVKPTAALFTVIGDAHLEFLHSREGVLKAKSEVLDFLPEDGKVFANADDPLLAEMKCTQKKVSFGFNGGEIRTENICSDGADSQGCDIIYCGGRIPVKIPAYGMHMIYAALEGAAVGLEYGLDEQQIIAGIASYRSVGDRARVEKTGYVTLINDCYNSNPTSASAALKSLSALTGRRVAILGDMLELGEKSTELHFELGRLAGSMCDLVIGCGPLGMHIADGAAGTGYQNKEALLSDIPHIIRSGDTVLVKASRSMKFEDICAAIRELK